MKKLLSLLSVLTVIGTAMPTTIAASPYQKQANLIRNKRENNNDDEFITIHEGRKNRKNHLLLIPDTFEEISHIFYSSNSEKNFVKSFKNVNCKCKCSTFYMNENLIFKLNS